MKTPCRLIGNYDKFNEIFLQIRWLNFFSNYSSYWNLALSHNINELQGHSIQILSVLATIFDSAGFSWSPFDSARLCSASLDIARLCSPFFEFQLICDIIIFSILQLQFGIDSLKKIRMSVFCLSMYTSNQFSKNIWKRRHLIRLVIEQCLTFDFSHFD